MRKTWFRRGRAAERYRDGQQWFNATYPGKWTGRGGTIRWHPRPTAETSMDYFRVWTPERAGLHSPFQDCLRPLGKNEGSCDVWCQRVRYGTQPSALQWTEACSNTHCKHEAPVVWLIWYVAPFDGEVYLENWTAQDIGRMSCNISDMPCNSESHYGELTR